MEIELILAIAALLLGRGWMPTFIGWLRKLRSKPLSANNISVVARNVRITLKPRGDTIIEVSAHAGDIVEPRSQAESADDVDDPTP